MTKPLQTKKRKHPKGVPTPGTWRIWILPAAVSTLLSLAPSFLFGQGDGPQEERFIRDNYGLPVSDAAETTLSGEYLRKLHPTDLLRALELADPSLCGFDPDQGSDPNAVPQSLSLQGTRSFAWNLSQADALPLVIVDGHSESMDRLSDFDMQRIESVTLLKNASATALLGVRAGQGAILIRTRTPEAHRLQLTYRFDGMFQKASLRNFDLMDAAQKLDWEKSTGAYDGNEALYDQRMADVRANGSTDWLNRPVRTSFSHRHRVSVDGGDSSLRYRGVLYLNPVKGVMKGSERKSYGGSAFIGYTTRSFQISNELNVDLFDAGESTAGAILEWARMDPYYVATDGRGVPYDVLGSGTFSEQGSPLYEMSLNSFAEDKIARVNNNLTVRWKIDSRFSIAGQFNLTHDYDRRSEFVSPSSLVYRGYTADEATKVGSYRIRRNELKSYQERIWADYRQEWNRHSLRASLGMEIYSATYTDNSFRGTGISSDHMDYVSFAQYYAEERPEGVEMAERVLSGYGTLSWNFDQKLFVDLSGRLDRSSRLAPEKRTAGSYGITARYDLRRSFLPESDFISRLSLSAGYGATAGYQFDYAQVNPLYAYDFDNPYLNGLGSSDYSEGLVTLFHSNVYNPALRWKTTRSAHIGIDGRFGPIDLTLKYYNSLSKNLMTVESQSPVFGSEIRYTNRGAIRNSGVEFAVAATILNNRNGVDLTLFVNGVANRSRITALPDYSSDLFLAQVLAEGSCVGMVRGDAADGIYVLPSAGIDPDTGRELFYSRDGSLTDTPQSSDLVFEGSRTPKLRGRFGATAAWRNLDLGVVFAYSLRGTYYDIYTQQAVDWASTADNVPTAALDKWSPSHPDAAFQGGDNPSHYASSRFVSKRNTLSLASVRVGYAFPKKIAAAMRMQGLKVSLTCDDVWFVSSVKTPRSLYYPYASSFILSLQATF